ncbi:DUF2380 domain-containing protein [Corallococcus sp. bb12-1]|uniref:DUF2380 domain-containing protein n=1 Tax=Corallococcus sp. bb12-1 TaxID=2996784 RepID=UPI00226D676E|nr:DUF2380 domain-containing protein [Corallococcus sp. bb12-1]MCY1044589.1 DUF2380 domain-containing protein [Corallococcus sp. bb12-1]
MRTGALVLSVVLLTTGCASPSPGPGRRMRLNHARHVVSGPPVEVPEPRSRGQHPGEDLGGQDATPTRQAVLDAIADVKGSTESIARALSKLDSRGDWDVFTRYTDYGSSQLPWLRGAQGSVALLANTSEAVADADMAVGLLRMTGPRLQAAMSGAMLLAAWLDFLRLAEAVREQCPFYGTERLFVDMDRVQKLIEPSMTALASLEPEQVEATARALPVLMAQLTREFQSIQEGARVASERAGKVIAVAQFMEMLTLVSTLRMSLPKRPPAAPAMLGVGLAMGSGGVMTGTRVVVSAEWVERMRRLVQAGVISVPAVSSAIRVHAGQVMMSQSNRDLPQGVRDALGDSPEVRGMHETGRAGAGMSDAPKHHVLPREHREWFEKRGFKGAMDIDQFCVRMEEAHHEAIHGGGNWRLGRTWAGEWNRMIMGRLRDAESAVGRMLTRNEILNIVAAHMQAADIPMNFIRGGRR